jgi:hypothetical protein
MMKRIIIIPVLVIFGLFCFSCNKNVNTQSSGNNSINTYDGSLEPALNGGSQPVISYGGSTGYILRQNASLMIFENDTGVEADKVKWSASMTLGERVTALGERRATYDGRAYDFVEIRRDDGKEGLAFATQIAAGATLAVVVDDKANLYTSAKTASVTGLIISQKTIVAILPGTESDGYVEIKAFDPVSGVNRQSFVRLNALSRKNSDIQSSILLQIAQPLKNEGADLIRKEALLNAAMIDYPDSVFNAEIVALVNPNTTATIKTESTSRPFMFVNTDNVEVRDLPDLVAGKLIGRLDDGTEVTVSERTANASTVNGRSDRWYRITEPYEGWVFGTNLD